MTFNRVLEPKLRASLKAGRSVILFGPRQTGKTTLIKALCAEMPLCMEYPLQLPSVRAKIEADPESLRREIEAACGRGRPVVFIDEIQKVPAVMDVLQYLLDEKKAVLIATGSSARKMRQTQANWLPGRVMIERLHPLTWKESGLIVAGDLNGTALKSRLLFGGLPGILSEKADLRVESLRSYSDLYLEEEIRREAVVRSLPPFAKFLRLAALESGTSPNFSKMAGEVGVSHTSIRDYFQILEDSLIIHRLEAFGKSRSNIVHKSKYYFFDLGVRNAASGVGHDPGLLVLQMGLLFEHLIILEAVAASKDCRFSYWRNKKGEEVDLVVEKSAKRLAIEIKATAKPRESDFSGLVSFRRDEKSDAAYLVCQVERPQKFPHGTAVPWQMLGEILSLSPTSRAAIPGPPRPGK